MPPIEQDFTVNLQTDNILSFQLSPAVNISGLNLQFQVMKNFGGISGLITCSVNSGFNNVSGFNVTDGINGAFSITVGNQQVSGIDPGVYAYSVRNLSSGNAQVLARGYMQADY